MKKPFISLLFIFLLLISSTSGVSAMGNDQYFLNFLYSPTSKSFTVLVQQNTGQFEIEDLYSNIGCNTPSFLLDNKLNAIDCMVEENGIKAARPYTFPEFGDVDGTDIDKATAITVGNALTESLSRAVVHILKPVSKEGLEELEIGRAHV